MNNFIFYLALQLSCLFLEHVDTYWLAQSILLIFVIYVFGQNRQVSIQFLTHICMLPGSWSGPHDIKQNNQLTLLETLGKEYKISFEVFVVHFKEDPWQSVIHFTLGGNMDKYGDRTPAVWIKNDKKVTIASAISGDKNAFDDICCLEAQKWTKIEISQLLVDGKVWIPYYIFYFMYYFFHSIIFILYFFQ